MKKKDKIKVINDILLCHEEELSDGYKYYHDNPEENLILIAEEIIKKIGG